MIAKSKSWYICHSSPPLLPGTVGIGLTIPVHYPARDLVKFSIGVRCGYSQKPPDFSVSESFSSIWISGPIHFCRFVVFYFICFFLVSNSASIGGRSAPHCLARCLSQNWETSLSALLIWTVLVFMEQVDYDPFEDFFGLGLDMKTRYVSIISIHFSLVIAKSFCELGRC